jgi:hypothetical protein
MFMRRDNSKKQFALTVSDLSLSRLFEPIARRIEQSVFLSNS